MDREREALAEKTAARVKTARKTRTLHPRKPRVATPSLPQAEADLEVARAEADAAKAARAELEATAEAEGRRLKGPIPDLDRGIARAEADLVAAEAAEAGAAAADRINTTDGDSGIMKNQKGYLQGYNPQAVVSEDHIILAAEVSTCAADVGQYLPMVDATLFNLTAAGIDEAIGWALADAGYLSNENLGAAGPARLIATAKAFKLHRQALKEGLKEGHPLLDASLLEAMTHRLLTAEGKAAYAKRQHTVEPVFGQIKENRGYRRFMRRGHPAVAAEWKLLALTHNLLKLFAKANDPEGRSTTAPGPSHGLDGAQERSHIRTFCPVALPEAA